MKDAVKRLYDKTGNIALVDNALHKGWISQGEYAEILDGITEGA